MFQVLEQRPSGHLPTAERHSRRNRNRGHGAADGLRQPRDRLPARASLSAATRPRERPSPRRLPAQPQGEDVVAGVHNTEDLSDLARRMPEIHRQLIADLAQLEGHYRDMQDVEYTVEEGRLFILQTRNAEAPRPGGGRFAHDAVGEGLLDRAAALHTIDAGTLEPGSFTFDPDAEYTELTRVAASPGAAGRDRVQRPSGRAACRGRAMTSCWCGRSPRRTTSAASRRRAGSSPPRRKSSTPRSSPGAWVAPQMRRRRAGSRPRGRR